MKRVLSLLICICQLSCVIAQNPEDTLTIQNNDSIDIIMPFSLGYEMPNMSAIPNTPPSPQGEAFVRLGQYDMNNNYGVPDIQIPICTLNHYGFTIPINLRYEARPLRPMYNYDVVGLGWAMTGNSCVSRNIMDIADEYGFFNNPFEIEDFTEHDHSPKLFKNYYNDLDKFNFRPDSYNIVLPSGRVIPFFFYKQEGIMVYKVLPNDQNIKIECNYDSNNINSFVVTDESGVKYSFMVADRANNIYQSVNNFHQNVTWLLTRIEIPSKGSITYQYNEPVEFYTSVFKEPVLHINHFHSPISTDMGQGYTINIDETEQCTWYRMRFLKKITCAECEVSFNYEEDGKHLKQITINYGNNTEVQAILNMYSYTNYSVLTRLTLQGSNEEDKLVYNMGYTDCDPGENTDHWGNLCRNSNAQDIGNFNIFVDKIGVSISDIQHEIARGMNRIMYLENDADDIGTYYKLRLQSSNYPESRQPTSPNLHRVLRYICYPNGGYTSFEYENHRFLTATAYNGDLEFDRRKQRIVEGGGFRIKSIKNYTATRALAGEDHYEYGYTYGNIIEHHLPFPIPEHYNSDLHIGCGEAVVDPNMLTYMDFNYTPLWSPPGFMDMITGQEHSAPCYYIWYGDVSAWWWDAYFSPINFRRLLNGRQPVVYPEITVYHGDPTNMANCIGKTVYQYDIYEYNRGSGTYYLSAISHNYNRDTTYYETTRYASLDNPLLISEENPALRHQLKSKTEFSYDHTLSNQNKWIMTSREEYSYFNDVIQVPGYTYNTRISRGHGDYSIYYASGKYEWNLELLDLYSPTVQTIGDSKLKKKKTTLKRMNGSSEVSNTFEESYTYTLGNLVKTRTYTDVYPKIDSYDYVGENTTNSTIVQDMIERNMLNPQIMADTYLNHSSMPRSVITGYKIDYAAFNEDTNSTADAYDILPSMVYARNNGQYEANVQILSYTSHGQPSEIVDLKTSTHTVYLWSHNDRFLAAEISNTTIGELRNRLSYNLSNVSKTMIDSLRTETDNMQIKTWAYNDFGKITEFTDVTGQTFRYEYDTIGRLKTESRINNNAEEILHEYMYNFTNARPW